MNHFITIITLSTSLISMTGYAELQNLTEQNSQAEQTNNNAPNNAVEVVANEIFENNTRIKFSAIGLTLTIPQEWRGTVSGEVFLMEAANIGNIIIVPDNTNEEESRQTMSNAIDLGDGIFLQPNTLVNQQGNILSAEYAVFGTAQPSVGYAVKVMGGHSHSYAIIAIAQKNKLAALKSAVDTTVNSMAYFQPTTLTSPTSTNTQTNNSNNYWAQELAGTRLTYFNTGSGFRTKIVVVLCSDGSFFRNSESGGFDNYGFSTASQGGSNGQWSTSGSANPGVLQLNYNDGVIGNYNILTNDEGLLLNGDRYFREDAGC